MVNFAIISSVSDLNCLIIWGRRAKLPKVVLADFTGDANMVEEEGATVAAAAGKESRSWWTCDKVVLADFTGDANIVEEEGATVVAAAGKESRS